MATMSSERLPTGPSERDASQLDPKAYVRRELPALASQREQRYQIAILQSVMDDIHAHGKSSIEIEVCGVLLGTVYQDSKGPWCLVDASVRGNFSSSRQTQVTITSATWTHVNEVRDRDYPEKKFVGWYHTHPGFGIFLSGMDDFIQANWFAEPWQIALVYDPKSGEEGVFLWRAGNSVNEPFLVVPADGAAAYRAGDVPPAGGNSNLPSGTLNDLMSRIQATERRQHWILVALAAVGLIAVGWPLAVFLVIGLAGISSSPKSVQPAATDPSQQPIAVRAPTHRDKAGR